MQAILRNDGFFSADVTVNTVPARGNEKPRVDIKVRRGVQAQVRDVQFRITGPAANDPELKDLTTIPSLAPGDPFVAGTWQSSKRALVDTLNRHGYLRARVASAGFGRSLASSAVSPSKTWSRKVEFGAAA